ncbi:MAG: hypothetical protein AAFX40_08095 [Cyanobacteria bacterium J06639_1]
MQCSYSAMGTRGYGGLDLRFLIIEWVDTGARKNQFLGLQTTE